MTSLTLVKSGLLEIFTGCLLGWFMLVPKQPWGKTISGVVRNWKKLGGAHLDLLLLGLLQVALAASSLVLKQAIPSGICLTIIVSSWLNVLPYLIAAVTPLDPFVLAGSPAQKLVAGVSGASSTCLTAALGSWLWLIV